MQENNMERAQNYTTPEQSERLLTYGVPANSADAYYDRDEVEIDEMAHPYLLPSNRTFASYDQRFYIPCWSLAQLLYIYETCTGIQLDRRWTHCKSWFDDIMSRIETCTMPSVLINMDFSKLDD